MNAYELADELEKLLTDGDWKHCSDTCVMLRMQADEITALRKQLNDSQTERA